MTSHRTSAKSRNTLKKPRWVYPVCPVCKHPIPYSATRFAYLVKVGKDDITCSKECGAVYRRMRKQTAMAGATA